jgi:hypothetical protein
MSSIGGQRGQTQAKSEQEASRRELLKFTKSPAKIA